MLKYLFSLLFLSLLLLNSPAQIVINEASNRNYSQVVDEDGEFNDWIELYNNSSRAVNLNGWSLSDKKTNPLEWSFAPISVPAQGFVLVYASGKNKNHFTESLIWESAVLPENEFRYLIPAESTSNQWNQLNFNDSAWEKGQAGFGYGDNDDNTIVDDNSTVIFIRKKFTVTDLSVIKGGKLHIDYDDGFVAYLNGVEIARSNAEGTPRWNSIATNNHEAAMYNGGSPEVFEIPLETISSVLKQGDNVFAVAALNVGSTSSDFSLIPFLSFALTEGNSMFQPTPDWFLQAGKGNLHTNFQLKSEGEKIYLSKSGVVLDSLDVDDLQRDHSIGRTTDGATTLGIFSTATPGTKNTSKAYTEGYCAKPKFSLPAGFYSGSIDVTLSTDEPNTQIRYTLDGSEPVETSPLYSSARKFTSTGCLRARCFASGKLPSKITTATYFINEDYELPVLSVTSDDEYIFGNQGIFPNWNQTFDVPAYVEFFEVDKKLAFHQNAGMQVDGGAGGSRSLAQHSFRMEPGNGTLGDGDLNYRLIPRRPNRTNYPSFYVRNGSNQHLVLPYKDALQVTSLGRNTYTYYSAYRPIAVYINAEFFGIYELREKINDDYLVDNYQMNIDSLDFLGVSYFKGQKLEALRGSIQPYLDDYKRFLQMDTEDEDYLTDVDEFLDLKSYTDYIIAESWVGNNDWPNNNIKVFRCPSTGFRWQWAINDLEWALNPNGWTTSSFDHIQYMQNHGTGNYYTAFWFNMMKNEEYKAYFVNRFADLMNTSYDFSVIGPLENEMFNEMNAEMVHEYERWGSNPTSQMKTFERNHQTFRSELSVRSEFVRDDLMEHFDLQRQVKVKLDVEPKGAGSIQISTITPTTYPWEGIYFGGVNVEIKAIPNIGYEFVNWDNSSFFTDLMQAEVTGVFKSSTARLYANFREIDSENSGVVISEINYKSGTNGQTPDWIEICNFENNEVNLNGWWFTDSDSSHVFKFNRDQVLAPKQRMIVCNDLQLFQAAYPGISVYASEFDFGLGTFSDEIRLYNPEKEIVFQVRYSDNYPWPLSDDQSGRTLELRSSNGDFSEANSWFKGCIGGSPGSSYQFCDEVVVSAPSIVLSAIDLKVYPNPARHFMEVEFALDNAVDFCNVTVYNLTGAELLSKEMGSLERGSYQTNFDLEAVQSQLLLVKLETNRGQKLMKILKVE